MCTANAASNVDQANIFLVLHLTAAWGGTIDFKRFASYLHVASDQLISEQNYPASNTN